MNPMDQTIAYSLDLAVPLQSDRQSEEIPSGKSTFCKGFSRNHYQTKLPSIRVTHQRVSLKLDPCEAQLGFVIQDILRSSEKCFPEKNGEEVQNTGIKVQYTPANGTSNSSDESDFIPELSRSLDAAWDKLEDPPVTCGSDELPVAASLIQHLDLFLSQSSTTTRAGKRRIEVSEDEESEEDADEDEKLVYGSDFSWHGSTSVSPLEDQWSERFRELTEFKKKMGHCSVPHNFQGNPVLARWVKRQRHQYKQLRVDVGDGEHLPGSIRERVQALRELGFVFDCQRTAWDEKFSELQEYQSTHLDCNVPSNYPTNPALAMWVKCQRRQYKMLKEGKKSGMTQGRIQQLEEISFTWELRRYNKRGRMNESFSLKNNHYS